MNQTYDERDPRELPPMPKPPGSDSGMSHDQGEGLGAVGVQLLAEVEAIRQAIDNLTQGGK